jgi:hypothetical protein
MKVRALLAAGSVAALVAAPTRATIAQVAPIAIEESSGSFTLRTLPADRLDAGCASVAAGGTRGKLEGTAILRGARGTLRLRLVATGRVGHRVGGRWWVIWSTGAYAGRSGRGTFTARPWFTGARYRGVMVIAE